MCNLIQTWWIRRWYFLYINVCIILHIVALSKSFQFRHITFYTNNILFTRHYFYKQLILFNSFYLVIHLTLHLFIHILWCYRFSNGLQSKTNYKVHDWLLLNVFFKLKSWIPFSPNLCISQAFLCWRTYFHMCFQELFHRMMIMTLGRTCALEPKNEDRLV